MKKIIFTLLFSLLGYQATAQEDLKIYAGIDYFRNKSFSAIPILISTWAPRY